LAPVKAIAQPTVLAAAPMLTSRSCAPADEIARNEDWHSPPAFEVVAIPLLLTAGVSLLLAILRGF
jgi:hypothetical protein